jgi:hypothetical protein
MAESRVAGFPHIHAYQESTMNLLRGVSSAVSIVALTALTVLPAQATVIDHNAVDAVSGYSQETMDKIGELSFLFSHASVGANMVSGLNALHGADSGFYQLQTESAAGTPPASVVDGRFYEISRGNPGWSDKLAYFDQYLSDGWAGQVDLAMDKFCYIDENADAASYLSFMQGLEQKFAGTGTRLVYATMPLKTSSDSANILRNEFNAAVRSFVAGSSDRLLFDIADIEAWDATGEHTFTSGGNVYQQLAGGYSSDGGHLNATGSQRVALGFYAVANAALAPVPEPESYAMLLVGLGLLGGIVRRRKSGRSAGH